MKEFALKRTVFNLILLYSPFEVVCVITYRRLLVFLKSEHI